ncbi:hypothetical protein EYF80_025161 [Liparis tanakae]|uniref:Uncharacterized protein n=1 Tax=Liparis tanakae TaxID=230148 RepID=A0A4Z2HIH0_9TELE|nr:hypothetical protein EYF80_025161 [Liparis tanakae]
MLGPRAGAVESRAPHVPNSPKTYGRTQVCYRGNGAEDPARLTLKSSACSRIMYWAYSMRSEDSVLESFSGQSASSCSSAPHKHIVRLGSKARPISCKFLAMDFLSSHAFRTCLLREDRKKRSNFFLFEDFLAFGILAFVQSSQHSRTSGRGDGGRRAGYRTEELCDSGTGGFDFPSLAGRWEEVADGV